MMNNPQKAFSLLFASCSEFYLGSLRIPRMGIPWFLIVLFTARSLFDLLHLKLGKAFVPACIGLSVAGVVVGKYIWLPFSFDITMVVLVFLLMGYGMRNFDPSEKSIPGFLIAAAVWLLTLLIPSMMDIKYLEISARRYPLYPLCLVTALAGTLMISYISSLGVRYLGRLKAVPMFIGKHSLILMCVHTVIFMWEWDGVFGHISSKMLVRTGVMIGAELAIFCAIVFIKSLLSKKERMK